VSEYGLVESFELAAVEASAAGPDEIALLADGDVVHVSGRDRSTLSVEGDPVDVALDELVYVLTASTLVALSTDGSRVWALDLETDAAVATAAIPDADVVCVLTETELLGIDCERGSRRWSIDRPYADVGDDGGLTAGDDAVYHDTWTFVTGVDADGDEVLDVTLDSSVTDVGWTDGVLVAALQGGTLVGIDPESGAAAWETQISARAVAAGGRNGLLVRTDDGLLRVDATGAYESVDAFGAGDVYPARNGDLVCVHNEGMLATYHRRVDTDALAATVETDEIAAGDDLRVRIDSDLDRAANVPIEVTADGATLADAETTIDVPADDATHAAVAVTDVGRATHATVSVAVAGETLAEDPVSIDRPEPDADAITATLAVDRIDGSTVDATLSVENDGDTAPALSVREDDVAVGTVAPGERATASISAPYVPGEPLERTIVDETGGEVASASVAAADGRTAITLGTTIDDDFLFVDVTVSNGTDSPVSDELVVFGLGALDPIEREVECGEGATWTLSLGVPGPLAARVDGNTIRAQLEGTAASDSHELDVGDAFDEGSSSDAGGRAGGGGAGVSGAGASGSGGGDGIAGVSANVARAVGPDRVAGTERFYEYVAVEPRGRVDDLVFVVDGDEHAVGSIPAGTEQRFERAHAVDGDGEFRLDPLSVVADGEDVGEPARETLSVVSGPLAARTRVDWSNTVVHVDGEIENRTDDYLDLVGVWVASVGTWDLELGSALAPGEVVEWAGDVDTAETGVTPDTHALDVTVEYGDPNDPLEFHSLAAVERASADSLVDRLDVHIGEDTRVRDEYSTVVLEVTNVGEDPARDVAVTALGDAVNDVVYVAEDFEAIAPGETVVHPIDVKPAGDDLALEVEIDGAEHTERLELSGPVAPRDGEWTREHYEAWSTGWLTAGPSGPGSFPPHVAGTFERTR
jgi:hypothetical protein